jgi:endonuclease-3
MDRVANANFLQNALGQPTLVERRAEGSPLRDEDIVAVLRAIRTRVRAFRDVPAVDEIAGRTRDPFQILVATLISLRTREEVTRPATQRLLAIAHTPAAMARLRVERIARAIAPAGFAPTKARVLRDIARRIEQTHGGRVPDTLEALLAFKGVGLKTANLVLAAGFGKPAICVDVHVHRVFNRLGYVRTRTPDQTEAALRAKLPRRYWARVNHWMVVFGRNQCTPTRPRCSSCPVERHCDKVGVDKTRAR